MNPVKFFVEYLLQTGRAVCDETLTQDGLPVLGVDPASIRQPVSELFNRNRVLSCHQKFPGFEITDLVEAFQSGKYMHPLIPLADDFPATLACCQVQFTAQRSVQGLVY